MQTSGLFKLSVSWRRSSGITKKVAVFNDGTFRTDVMTETEQKLEKIAGNVGMGRLRQFLYFTWKISIRCPVSIVDCGN